MTMNYNAAQQQYSEIAGSRILVALTLVDLLNNPLKSLDGQPLRNVSYWDSLSGGDISRTITPRKRPGQINVSKIPGMHLNVAAINLTRAWNRKREHRQPIEPLLRMWLKGKPIVGVRIMVEQFIIEDDGSVRPYDMYIGPISSYGGPKGNTEGDALVNETLSVDPEYYDLLEDNTPVPPLTTA